VGLVDFLIPALIVAAALVVGYVGPVVAGGILVFVALFANPIATVIDYRLTETALEVTVFRRYRFRRLPYEEILEVRRTRWAELFARDMRWAESLGSHLFRSLVLVRRQGGRRPAIVTPGDADGFIRALRARLRANGDRAAAGGTRQGA
jgi:hypothetical protein